MYGHEEYSFGRIIMVDKMINKQNSWEYSLIITSSYVPINCDVKSDKNLKMAIDKKNLNEKITAVVPGQYHVQLTEN